MHTSGYQCLCACGLSVQAKTGMCVCVCSRLQIGDLPETRGVLYAFFQFHELFLAASRSRLLFIAATHSAWLSRALGVFTSRLDSELH